MRGSSSGFGEHGGRFLEGAVPDHRLCHEMTGCAPNSLRDTEQVTSSLSLGLCVWDRDAVQV